MSNVLYFQVISPKSSLSSSHIPENIHLLKHKLYKINLIIFHSVKTISSEDVKLLFL